MKLSDIKTAAQIPTELEGVFIQDLSLEKVEELGNLESADDSMAPLVWLFNNLIVAEDGTKFEDALTEEDIKKNLTVIKAKMITEAALEAMNAGGK